MGMLVWSGLDALFLYSWVTFNPAGVQGSYHKLVQNWSHVAFGPVLLFAFCPRQEEMSARIVGWCPSVSGGHTDGGSPSGGGGRMQVKLVKNLVTHYLWSSHVVMLLYLSQCRNASQDCGVVRFCLRWSSHRGPSGPMGVRAWAGDGVRVQVILRLPPALMVLMTIQSHNIRPR
jgi:hypothetical protein